MTSWVVLCLDDDDAHMPRCCTSAHEEPTILHRQPSPPLVLMCHRTLLRPAAVLDVPVRDQAAPHCEAIARVNWGTRAAGTDADVPEPQRIPAQEPADNTYLCLSPCHTNTPVHLRRSG